MLGIATILESLARIVIFKNALRLLRILKDFLDFFFHFSFVLIFKKLFKILGGRNIAANVEALAKEGNSSTTVQSLTNAGLSYKKLSCQIHPFGPNIKGEIAESGNVYQHIWMSSRMDQ